MKKTLFILLISFVLSINVGFAGGPIDGGPISGGGTSPATTTSAGIVELATDAETVTGTATDKVTTPANITAKMSAPGVIGDTVPATSLAAKETITSHSATEAITVITMYGNIHRITGAYTLTLPSAVIGMKAVFRVVTAAVFSLKAGASDHQEMFDGTVLDNGDKQTSGGTKNEFIEVYCETVNTWITVGINGAFSDGGA